MNRKSTPSLAPVDPEDFADDRNESPKRKRNPSDIPPQIGSIQDDMQTGNASPDPTGSTETVPDTDD